MDWHFSGSKGFILSAWLCIGGSCPCRSVAIAIPPCGNKKLGWHERGCMLDRNGQILKMVFGGLCSQHTVWHFCMYLSNRQHRKKMVFQGIVYFKCTCPSWEQHQSWEPFLPVVCRSLSEELICVQDHTISRDQIKWQRYWFFDDSNHKWNGQIWISAYEEIAFHFDCKNYLNVIHQWLSYDLSLLMC